ncbi:MAG: ATP-binding protein, partial [Chitinophagaceae bacterium]
PVSQIVQLLQLQKENPNLFSKAVREQYDTKLKTASENVLDTMEDLLLWSKSQMQNFTPEQMPVHISAIMQKELELLNQVIEKNNLIIENTIAANIIINTDENFLGIILRNLLQNAFNHTDHGGTIKLSADLKNIFIENAAFGANVETLNALLKTNVINSKTSGLGLQIANDLALSIQAKIIFEQTPGNKIVASIKWLA